MCRICEQNTPDDLKDITMPAHQKLITKFLACANVFVRFQFFFINKFHFRLIIIKQHFLVSLIRMINYQIIFAIRVS